MESKFKVLYYLGLKYGLDCPWHECMHNLDSAVVKVSHSERNFNAWGLEELQNRTYWFINKYKIRQDA